MIALLIASNAQAELKADKITYGDLFRSNPSLNFENHTNEIAFVDENGTDMIRLTKDHAIIYGKKVKDQNKIYKRLSEWMNAAEKGRKL